MEVTCLVTESRSRARLWICGQKSSGVLLRGTLSGMSSAVHKTGKASLCFTSLGKPWESCIKIKNAYSVEFAF